MDLLDFQHMIVMAGRIHNDDIHSDDFIMLFLQNLKKKKISQIHLGVCILCVFQANGLDSNRNVGQKKESLPIQKYTKEQLHLVKNKKAIRRTDEQKVQHLLTFNMYMQPTCAMYNVKRMRVREI